MHIVILNPTGKKPETFDVGFLLAICTDKRNKKMSWKSHKNPFNMHVFV